MNQRKKAALVVIASLTLPGCAKDTPLDHYWDSAHCTAQADFGNSQLTRSCVAYLRRQGSTQSLIVRLGTDFSVEQPATQSLLIAVNPTQAAPSTLGLVGDAVLVPGPSVVPVGHAYVAYNPTDYYNQKTILDWSVGKGQVELRQLVLGEQRTADRDFVSVDMQLTLSSADFGGASLPGTVTIHASDGPQPDAGVADSSAGGSGGSGGSSGAGGMGGGAGNGGSAGTAGSGGDGGTGGIAGSAGTAGSGGGGGTGGIAGSAGTAGSGGDGGTGGIAGSAGTAGSGGSGGAAGSAGAAGQGGAAGSAGSAGSGNGGSGPVGPIAWFAFDESTGTSALDSSGQGHDGTHNASYVAGKKGTAIQLGVGKTVTVPASASLAWGQANADFSVVYWVRVLTASTGYQSILHHGNSNLERTSAHFLGPTGLQACNAISTVNNYNEFFCTASFPLATWTHLADIKAGNVHSIYINGVSDASNQLSSATQGFNAPIYMGTSPWLSGANVQLDEVKIFARALSAAEIQLEATP